jgi:hypothetical protein
VGAGHFPVAMPAHLRVHRLLLTVQWCRSKVKDDGRSMPITDRTRDHRGTYHDSRQGAITAVGLRTSIRATSDTPPASAAFPDWRGPATKYLSWLCSVTMSRSLENNGGQGAIGTIRMGVDASIPRGA